MPALVRAASWAVACAAALAACTPVLTQSAQPCGRTAVTDHGALIGALRAAGAKVVQEQMLSQPFFDVEARILEVDGEGVQVFEYGDAATAAAQAARVSGDGSQVGTSKPHWVAPPHFYRQGRLLVLYLGDDTQTLGRLACLLGPPFAGR
jgi:hypothetical protein